jgi:DNA processing protein
MALGYEPRARDFPRRNRIVSGLSYGVVVVEAARRSGSLITARFAIEQGREVFAVPGSPLDPRAEGTNDLIRQGATLCGTADDVVSALEPLIASGFHDGVGLREGIADDDASLLQAEFPWGSGDRESDSGQGAESDGPAGNLAIDPVLALLSPSPIGVDELVRLSGLPIRVVQTTLLELEIAGRLERHGGNAVSLVPGR